MAIGSHARTAPDHPAIVTLARTLTFSELEDRQSRLVGALARWGARRGDRVAILSDNRPELLEATVGALRGGIVPVPLNPALTPPEIGYLLEDSGARWLFTDRAVEAAAPALESTVTFGDAYERLLHEATGEPLADVALGRPMHYTSGTTGKPRGVWVEPFAEERGAQISSAFRSLWALEADDRHLVCSPLSHSAPHRFALRTLEAGGTVILQARFDPAETVAAIELFGATTTFMVPTHLERIFADDLLISRHDVSSLRLLAHAGAPIRKATKRKAIAGFPEGSVWEFYGSTEGQATRISSAEWLRKPGSVGTALPGAEVVILDDDLERLPAAELGDVWVHDPAAERFEYWGDPAKTAAAWNDGAFTVGDVGYLDEDGYLFLAGRKHGTIITGGVNVYPVEVEQVLCEHPAVAEALVYGVAQDEWGQEVRAKIVPAWGQPLDADALRDWARERLAGFKCPKRFEIVRDLPRTATGKTKRSREGDTTNG